MRCLTRMFVIDVGFHKIAIAEAKKLGIPVIGVVGYQPLAQLASTTSSPATTTPPRLWLCMPGMADAVLEGKANAVNEVVQAAAADDEFVEVNDAA